MSSYSETGFGAKIRKAQDLLLLINSFPVYDPPRDEESIAEMTLLVDQIIQLNTDEAAFKEQYRIAVNDRQNAFRRGPGSVEKLLSPVANAVKAQYGDTAKQMILISELIRKMRSPKSSVSKETGTKTPVSKSEHSYGSVAKTFNDLVVTLTQFGDYDPSNPEITVPALQQKVVDLTALSDAVAEKAILLKSTKDARVEKYRILKERIVRIKAYIKAHYGNDSSQYDTIRTMKL